MVEVVSGFQTMVGYHNEAIDYRIEEVWVDVFVAEVHDLLI